MHAPGPAVSWHRAFFMPHPLFTGRKPLSLLDFQGGTLGFPYPDHKTFDR
jgi:hypothetical protein